MDALRQQQMPDKTHTCPKIKSELDLSFFETLLTVYFHIKHTFTKSMLVNTHTFQTDQLEVIKSGRQKLKQKQELSTEGFNYEDATQETFPSLHSYF